MRRRPSVSSDAVLVAAFATLTACGGGSGSHAAPNLLLITVDTLRADHLSTYGHERPTSPRIDALALSGVVFEDAQAHASWTLPAMASLMTSHVSTTHGCWTMEDRLDDSYPTLAELLSDAGWTTAGVPSHTFIGSRYGFAQGFDDFDEELVKEQEALSHRAITSDKVSDKGIAWLNQHAGSDRPFFLWLHYFDPHERYLRHEEFTRRVATPSRKEVSLYDGEIAFTDHHIGRVLDTLDALGITDRTLVVLTADHGEEFGDHGGVSHGDTLFTEVVRVPLILRVPGVAPARVAGTVRIIDVLPTVLELLDVPVPVVAGASLAPALAGESLAPRPALGELRLREGKHVDSLTFGRWKLVVDLSGDRTLLFDREMDPTETMDVAAMEPDVVDELSSHLQILIGQAALVGESFQQGAHVELDDNDRAMLDDLGYTGDQSGAPRSARDPNE
jgi:arylsulfatase A-like enzyme